MATSVLENVYDPEAFRKLGHELVDSLANHLSACLAPAEGQKVMDWQLPEDELAFWRAFDSKEPTEIFNTVLQRCIHTHHPKYIGHQVSAPAPITTLSAMLSALLNNGMAVYEMGKAPSAIERVITDKLCEKIGYSPDARGFLTSGGTLANLTALLTARREKAPENVWESGYSQKLGIMVSEEAHYCVDRAARIMGLGSEGIIKIPSTIDFVMDTSLLDTYMKKAKAQGIYVFAIVGSAPSTSTGMYDDLETIASFAQKHQLWFHVDGAHGGSAVFSPKYKNTLKGIDQADSVVIDGHKMMLMPAITTALLYKDGNTSYTTFSQKADYLLLQSQEEDWYNKAKRTFECTKLMMSLHWYMLWQTEGETLFDDFVTTLYDKGIQFAKTVQQRASFELAVSPMSNIVCFRLKHVYGKLEQENALNLKIRQQLLEDGEFYIVQTKLRGKQYLRVTLMNPFTTETILEQLLDHIEEIGRSLI